MPNPPLKFSKYLVAYVDVLGFKEVIRNMRDDAQVQNDFLSNYLVQAVKHAKKIEATKQLSNINLKIKIISDTFFFYIPINLEENNDDFGNDLVLNLAHMAVGVGGLQAFLSSIGIWTRGAICYGDLIVHNNNIVGPALINSYILESEQAINPRVILDNSIIKFFRSTTDLVSKVNQVQFDNWAHDKLFYLPEKTIADSSFYDDLIFVDYFNFFITNHDSLEMYKKTLVHLKKGLSSNPSIYKKYKWTQKYFYFKYNIYFSQYGAPQVNVSIRNFIYANMIDFSKW